MGVRRQWQLDLGMEQTRAASQQPQRVFLVVTLVRERKWRSRGERRHGTTGNPVSTGRAVILIKLLKNG
jgi:hypothetical protein